MKTEQTPLPTGHRQTPRYRELVTVGLGGVLGANARYGVGKWVADHWGSAFPWGTLLINITGSFALGFFLILRERGAVGAARAATA